MDLFMFLEKGKPSESPERVDHFREGRVKNAREAIIYAKGTLNLRGKGLNRRWTDKICEGKHGFGNGHTIIEKEYVQKAMNS